jgi:DNA-binding transcriptional ArsR family regulator
MQQPNKSEIELLHAEICQALADPTRILLLYQLGQGPKCVNELVTLLNLSQPTVSRHLKVLRERGMAKTKRIGTTVTYSLADHRVIEALDLMRVVLINNLAQKSALAEILTAAA